MSGVAAELARVDVHGRVARLTLGRPEARNALSLDLLRALRAALAGVQERAARGEVTVLILTGEGKAFCAGMDLKAVLGDDGLARTLLNELAEFTLELRALPAVTLARVNGAAIGGGCGLACVCDFVVTHADAKMGFPEVDLGVCPAVVAPWVVRRVGAGRARQLLLAGGLMSGAQAVECGLATHAAADAASLDGATEALTARLAQGGPGALRATKALLNELDGSLETAAVMRGAELSASVLRGEEARSMLRAHLSRKG